MTSDEVFQEKYGRDVYAGEAVQAAIGQAESQFTPLQLAEYCATIANRGTRYSASILKAVRSYDYSKTIYERQNEILSKLELDQEVWDVLHTGMLGVIYDEASTLTDLYLTCEVEVAAKTGTAQRGEGLKNNALFIAFAPYENPEIAIAIAVEKGGAGATLAPLAKQVIDYYFSFEKGANALEPNYALLK